MTTHPDELSYVPFEVASLMTERSVTYNQTLPRWVRSEFECDGGACPMPTHGPQASSSMRTPAMSRWT